MYFHRRMLFNSIDFAVFLVVVFALYWAMPWRWKWQNLLVLAASYVFYGWWDWRFLSLIVVSTAIDFAVASALGRVEDPRRRKGLLAVSLTANLGLLGFFKYYDFFVESFTEAFTSFGAEIEPATLGWVLPVGISFYTFQTLSYTIDVYRRTLAPEKNLVAFGAYVSFFPQLVAGPIERASNLLPQFGRQRTFDTEVAADGLRQMLWGLFKKVVIADNCARFADAMFGWPHEYSGAMLALGAVFFALQIYGDFSGYSDMAIGTAKLFGFELKQNFAFPYFSRDIAEFWRRWHISLSTWFRDYVYIPLGGSRISKAKVVRNTFIIFLVSGFWHGANWTFVIWGLVHALCFLPLLLGGRNRKYLGVIGQDGFPRWHEWLRMLGTFVVVCLAWVFFRASSLGKAGEYFDGLTTFKEWGQIDFSSFPNPIATALMIVFMLLVEWFGRRGQHGLQVWKQKLPTAVRWGGYVLILFFISMFMRVGDITFIYFQF